MATTQPPHQQSELTREDLLYQISCHEDAQKELEQEVLEIEAERNATPHLKKIAARDAHAIQVDEKLVRKQKTCEREIRARVRLIAEARKDIAELEIKAAAERLSLNVQGAIDKSVAFENNLQAFNPLLEELKGQMANFDAGCAALDTAIQSFPPWARVWCGKYFVQNFADRLRTVLATTFNGVIRGQKTDGPDFFTANSALFSGVHEALATMAASAHGGGPGRKWYIVKNGRLSGISGGLNLLDGERISLISDHAETKKFVELGNLKEEGSEN